MPNSSFYSYSQTTRELWSIFNTFRKLGFQSEDIFVTSDASQDGQSGYAGALVVQGDKTFTVTIPRNGTPPSTIDQEWLALAEEIDSFTEAELESVYSESWIRRNAFGLVAGLADKGLKPNR